MIDFPFTLFFWITDKSINLQQGICTAGYFQCENDTLCVKQGKNCDGIPDCPNSSDEVNCGKFYAEY